MSITYPLTIPGPLGANRAKLTKNSIVGEFISPFTGQAEQQSFGPPSEFWNLDLEFPQANWAQTAALDAFLGALRGKWGSFLWGPPWASSPRGSALGTPVVLNPSGGGPLGAQAASSGSAGYHTVAWSNPSGAVGSSGWASAVVPSGDASTFLFCSQFGFDIDPSIVPAGIQVSMTAYASVPGVTLQASLVSGSQGSPYETITLGTSPAQVVFGGPTDAWGTSPWTAALVNAAGFEALIAVIGGLAATVYVQKVQTQLFFSQSVSAGSNVLYTAGWTPNQSGVLLPGDFLQLTGTAKRLYQYCTPAPLASDANGIAMLDILPPLREVPVDGASVVLTNPTGTFRLAENLRDFPMDGVTRTATLRLKAREAI
jgi:hypothetical protein